MHIIKEIPGCDGGDFLPDTNGNCRFYYYQSGDIGCFDIADDKMEPVCLTDADIGALSALQIDSSPVFLYQDKKTDKIYLKNSEQTVLVTLVSGKHRAADGFAIQLESGRILVSCSLLLNDETTSCGEFFISDDKGASWQRVGGVLGLHSKCAKAGLKYLSACELSPGTVCALAATELGLQYAMISVNGGLTFCGPEPTGFSSPVTPFCMKKNANGFVCCFNPVPENSFDTQNPYQRILYGSLNDSMQMPSSEIYESPEAMTVVSVCGEYAALRCGNVIKIMKAGDAK